MSHSGAKTIFLMTSALAVVGVSLAAQAQTVTSPFAKKTTTQAWETTPSPAPTQSSSYVPPTYTHSAPSGLPPRPLSYQAPASVSTGAPTGNYAAPRPAAGIQTPKPTYSLDTPGTYPGLTDAKPSQAAGQYQPRAYAKPAVSYYDYPSTYQPVQMAQSNVPPRPPSGNPYPPSRPTGTPTQTQQPKSWSDRLGLRNLSKTFSGYLKGGAAATDRDGDWDANFILDGSVRGEISAITQGGIEYGIGGEVRGQYDKYRRGFGGRVGDCPPGIAGCASVDIAGTPTAIRGHTSQFYTSGPSNAKEGEVQLEGAYLFLRSGYGDFTVGRDDGAAYLFSLGAPTLVAVGASNSPVDYTGLDSVKTINDASGFAEKITYTSPRLLGDTVGIGVQFGASYAPDARACGVDYCVRRNGADGTGVLSPDLEDVIELGVALDRRFDNGLSVEATGTYATASENSGIGAFDGLEAFGLGLELGYMDWTVGGSYLNSNNGLANGDYVAWDAGLTWQPSQWGLTLGYGQAEDKNIGLESDQAVLGITYDWNENYRLGTGVQYIKRDVPVNSGGVVSPVSEDATAIFIEGRVTF